MSHRRKFGDVTLGGNGINNPVPLTQANYDLSGDELNFSYRQVNVIFFSAPVGINLYVTGLARINPATLEPMMGQNDICYLPCPPECS
jgi:hypothetical protein